MLKLMIGGFMDNDLLNIYKNYQEKVDTLWGLL